MFRDAIKGDDFFLPLTVSLVGAFINGISMWSVVFSARVAYEIVSDKKGVCKESYETANQNTLKSDCEILSNFGYYLYCRRPWG